MNVVGSSVVFGPSGLSNNSGQRQQLWAHGLSVSIGAKAILCGCKEKERGVSKVLETLKKDHLQARVWLQKCSCKSCFDIKLAYFSNTL